MEIALLTLVSCIRWYYVCIYVLFVVSLGSSMRESAHLNNYYVCYGGIQKVNLATRRHWFIRDHTGCHWPTWFMSCDINSCHHGNSMTSMVPLADAQSTDARSNRAIDVQVGRVGAEALENT